MEDVALGHVGDDDLVFQDLSFEVSFGHCLVPFDIEALGLKIEKAGELDLIDVIGRPHTKGPAAVLDHLQSQRRKVVELERRERLTPLIVNFEPPL